MAFVDEIQFHIKAGHGGNGVVRWRHEKGKEFMGPSGGNGGNGADVFIEAVRDIAILSSYRNTKEFVGENGGDGMKDSMYGKNGDDLVIKLPVGAIVKNRETGERYELLKEGERIQILKGGRGGLGNEHFKGSKNVTPQESTPGKVGEEADFFIELLLAVDAGLIGLPNAGKSSLLNVLTNATAKVGGYEFTTLEPNLGAFYSFVIADIPGLIEGASEGKGLGHKFLRHIKRTKLLLHCISLENEDVVSVYKTIRDELSQFDDELAQKPEILILTKTDTTDEKHIEKVKKEISSIFKGRILSVTIIDDVAVKQLKDEIVKELRLLS